MDDSSILPHRDDLDAVLRRRQEAAEALRPGLSGAEAFRGEQAAHMLAEARETVEEMRAAHGDEPGVRALFDLVSLLDAELNPVASTARGDEGTGDASPFSVIVFGENEAILDRFFRLLCAEGAPAVLRSAGRGPLRLVRMPLVPLSDADGAEDVRRLLMDADLVCLLWGADDEPPDGARITGLLERWRPTARVMDVGGDLRAVDGALDPQAVSRFLDGARELFSGERLHPLADRVWAEVHPEGTGFPNAPLPSLNFVSTAAELAARSPGHDDAETRQALKTQSRFDLLLERMSHVFCDLGVPLRIASLFDGARHTLDGQARRLRIRRKVLRDTAYGVFDHVREANAWFQGFGRRVEPAVEEMVPGLATPEDVARFDPVTVLDAVTGFMDTETQALAASMFQELVAAMEDIQQKNQTQAEFQGFDDIDLLNATRWCRTVAGLASSVVGSLPSQGGESVRQGFLAVVRQVTQAPGATDWEEADAGRLRRRVVSAVKRWFQNVVARDMRQRQERSLLVLKDGFFRIADRIWPAMRALTDRVDEVDRSLLIEILRAKGIEGAGDLFLRVAREPGDRIKVLVRPSENLPLMKHADEQCRGEWVSFVPESDDVRAKVVAALDAGQALEPSLLDVMPARGQRRMEVIVTPPEDLVGYLLGRKRVNQRLSQRLLGVTIRVVGDRRERRKFRDA